MNRRFLLAPLALAFAATAAAQDGSVRGGAGEGGPPRIAYGNPSAGIAADIERARLTGGKKGRWFALRQTAAPDAVMFVPKMVLAQSWLKARTEVAPGYKLRPYRAWSSCDGSAILTSGLWSDGGREGWYTTVWQRQSDGAYRWVFDHGGLIDGPQGEPDVIEGKVAECPPARPKGPPLNAGPRSKKRKPEKAPPIVLDPAGRGGRSNDGTLIWQVAVDPSGSHRFTASMRVSGSMASIRDEKVAAAGS